MNLKRRSLILTMPLVLLSLAGSNLPAQDQPPQPAPAEVKPNAPSSFGEIRVKGTQISEIDPTHVRVGVDLSIVPSRTVTLESLRLTSLRLNGLPVFAEPLLQPIVLLQGKEIALPPIYVTVQFRDLTTVEPLREMVEKQTVHVQAQVVSAVKMGFFEKLVLHTEHPRVSLSVSQDVPVEIGSSPLERQAALTVLTLLDMGLKSGLVPRDGLPGFESPWIREVETQAKTNIFEVESTYTLKEKETNYPVTLDQLGFRLASGQVIATAEARAPWAYDTEFLGKIKSGEAKLVKNSAEIQLFLPESRSASGIAATYSLTRKDFTITERGGTEKDSVIVPAGQAGGQANGPQTGDASAEQPVSGASGGQTEKLEDLKKVKVRLRNAPNSLSVIQFRGKMPAGGFVAAPAETAKADSWTKVAVFRLVSDPATSKDTVEVIQFSARRDGQSIHFDRPVDSSFFGSPILIPEGVLGVVQDEETGAFLPSDLIGAASVSAEGQPLGAWPAVAHPVVDLRSAAPLGTSGRR